VRFSRSPSQDPGRSLAGRRPLCRPTGSDAARSGRREVNALPVTCLGATVPLFAQEDRSALDVLSMSTAVKFGGHSFGELFERRRGTRPGRQPTRSRDAAWPVRPKVGVNLLAHGGDEIPLESIAALIGDTDIMVSHSNPRFSRG